MIEKPEDLFVGYVTQKAIIENDGKMLFVKSNNNDALWDFPSGRLHQASKIVLPEDELTAQAWLPIDQIVSGAVYDNCIAALDTYLHSKTIVN